MDLLRVGFVWDLRQFVERSASRNSPPPVHQALMHGRSRRAAGCTVDAPPKSELDRVAEKSSCAPDMILSPESPFPTSKRLKAPFAVPFRTGPYPSVRSNVPVMFGRTSAVRSRVTVTHGRWKACSALRVGLEGQASLARAPRQSPDPFFWTV